MIPAFADRRSEDGVIASTVVRSAWEATLFAERSGGWPIVLAPLEPGLGQRTHHVADAVEAALVLERDGRPWRAEQRWGARSSSVPC